MLIVEESLKAALNFTVSISEKLSTAQTWARILEPVVPLERLQESFDLAFENHRSTFPVNAYDIKQAWELLQQNEAKLLAEKEAELRETQPTKFCKQVHFEGEFNQTFIPAEEGLMLMSNGINEPEIPVPCFECRPVAYAQFLERRKHKTGEEIASQLMTQTNVAIYTDPLKILEKPIQQLGKEALQGNGQSKEMWQKLNRVRQYIFENKEQ